MEHNKKPAHEFRLGQVRATIWANRSENQDIWFNVRISRRYKDGDLWRESDSFLRDQLPLVAKAADMAYSWIWRRQMERDKADRRSNG